jgi:hypothetical protein
LTDESSTPRENTRPYVTVAAVCERVIEEKDGVLSAIRLIDQLSYEFVEVANQPAGTAAVEQPVIVMNSVDLTVLICLKAGTMRGDYLASLEMQQPGGKVVRLYSDLSVTFGEAGNGVNINTKFPLPPFAPPGVYWFVFRWDGEELTRFPFTLEQRRASGTTTSGTNADGGPLAAPAK